MRIVRYVAWVWFIIIGGLIITPKGVFCIVCGQNITQPGYSGETATLIVAIVAIVLGLVGIATEGRAQLVVLTKRPPGRSSLSRFMRPFSSQKTCNPEKRGKRRIVGSGGGSSPTPGQESIFLCCLPSSTLIEVIRRRIPVSSYSL